MDEHRLLLKLGFAEKMCVSLRDSMFEGSWQKMQQFIRTQGSESQKQDDLPRIERLMACEQQYGVNLRDLVEPPDTALARALKPRELKKAKLINNLLEVCQRSGLPPKEVQRVLEALRPLIEKPLQKRAT